MVRHSIGACFGGALHPVICGQIGIVWAGGQSPNTVALCLLAIAHLRAIDERPRGSVLDAAVSRHAGSCLTNGILTLAIRRRITTHADAIAIADQIHHGAAKSAFGDVRVFGNSIEARFICAFDAIVGHIQIIGRCCIDTRNALRFDAITWFVHYARRGHSIEPRNDANIILASFGRARIAVIAIIRGLASNASAAHAPHSASAAHACFAAAAAIAARRTRR